MKRISAGKSEFMFDVISDQGLLFLIERWEKSKTSLNIFIILVRQQITTRIPEMLGRFLNLKRKLKDILITWANILFTIEHREYKNCLNWDILLFYTLNELISNLMPATGLKKVGTGETKDWKSKTFWKDLAGTSSN